MSIWSCKWNLGKPALDAFLVWTVAKVESYLGGMSQAWNPKDEEDIDIGILVQGILACVRAEAVNEKSRSCSRPSSHASSH